jgi:hypothetical protein
MEPNWNENLGEAQVLKKEGPKFKEEEGKKDKRKRGKKKKRKM